METLREQISERIREALSLDSSPSNDLDNKCGEPNPMFGFSAGLPIESVDEAVLHESIYLPTKPEDNYIN
jgi:hypothetical protein